MLKIKTRNLLIELQCFLQLIFIYPSRSLSLYRSLYCSLSLYRSLSIALSHSSLRSWLLINFKTFLFFYYFPGNQIEFLTRYFFSFVFYDFRFDFLIKISAIELISPSRYYYIQIFTLFPIQTLRLGVFSISLNFLVLKAYI